MGASLIFISRKVSENYRIAHINLTKNTLHDLLEFLDRWLTVSL